MGFSSFVPLAAFVLSVAAAVLAVDMYRLLRAAETGRTWRVLIIASVIFALIQALRVAEVLHIEVSLLYSLSQIVELVFIVTLVYAFYTQRRAFEEAAREHRYQRRPAREAHSATEPDEADWNRLSNDDDEDTFAQVISLHQFDPESKPANVEPDPRPRAGLDTPSALKH